MWNADESGGRRGRHGVLRLLLSRLLTLALLAALLAGAVFGMLRLAEQPGPLRQRAVVLVERGEGSARIAELLERKGVVSSRHLMLAYLAWQRLLGHRQPLKAGEYAFRPGISLRQVVAELQTGKGILHRLSIPEGLSTVQVLARVREHPALTGDITVVPDEGALLPDTYLFTRGKTRDAIIHQMIDARKKLLAELWPKRREGLPLASPREAVILASIVEKETAIAEERPRIAAVFLNRLRKGMKLQADPTVIYGITKGWPLGRPLTKKDLRAKTPWNTYVIQGLPPTPIANPGRASIEAVLHPARTEDLYFVADGAGRHLFAADLKTHNRNVRKLRALERARAAEKERQREQADEKPKEQAKAQEQVEERGQAKAAEQARGQEKARHGGGKTARQ